MKKILISLLSLFIAAANTTGCAAKASSVLLNNSTTAESGSENIGSDENTDSDDTVVKTNALWLISPVREQQNKLRNIEKWL